MIDKNRVAICKNCNNTLIQVVKISLVDFIIDYDLDAWFFIFFPFLFILYAYFINLNVYIALIVLIIYIIIFFIWFNIGISKYNNF